MVGLQLGTLVAQVVIIGDLGPAIVSKATGLQVIQMRRYKMASDQSLLLLMANCALFIFT